jgi:ABC-type sugar transport system ATPase subunit
MQIKHRFLGTSNQVGEKKPDDAGYEQTPERNTVYEVQGLSIPKNTENYFKFFRGEVTTFLVMDRREKERIFQVLAGRSSEDGIRYLVNDRIYKGGEAALLTEEKVVSIGALGSREEIFTEMTVVENMLLPSLKKISQMEYIRYSSHLMKVVTDEGDIDEPVQGKKAGELGGNELLIMTLERWYLYRPQVLVLLEPFAMCDVDGVSVVKSYLLKFVESGTAVIIIKSRDEYIEDISNNIFCIE